MRPHVSFPAAKPMPITAKDRNHAPSPHRASIPLPRLIFIYILVIMPVMTWTAPRIRDPMSTGMASSSGSNSFHRDTLAGSTPVSRPRIWGIRSPKKPPVSAPQIKVLIPHSPSRGII